MNKYLVTISTTNVVEAEDETTAVDIAVDSQPETVDITVEELNPDDKTLPSDYLMPTSPEEVDD